MREELLRECERFIQNRDAFRTAFKWASSLMHPICAAVVQNKNTVYTAEEIRCCRETVKENAGFFSSFRGFVNMPVVALLLGETTPERKFANISEAYSTLKKHFHFVSSENLSLAAVTLEKITVPLNYDETAQRAKSIYEKLKKNHPLAATSENIAFCVLLTLSHMRDEELVSEIEKCYVLLKEEFSYSGSVITLSLMLSLIENMPAEEKCSRTIELYYALREKGIKYSRSYYLSTLGGLASICGDISSAADDISEVYDFLKTQKGYGAFGVSKQERALHSLLIVSSMKSADNTGTSVAAVVSTAVVIAAQIAAAASAAAAAAATAAT